MRVRALVSALIVVLAAPACGGGGDEEAAAPAPSASASTPATVPAPGRYDTLQEVADALGCKGLQDVGTGGNPGLAAFGVCYVGRHNVDIYLTSDRGLWEHLANQFPSVLGRNFIIVCPTGPRAARIVHDRIGGTLKIP